jgi:hypothetical protein
MHIQYYCIGAKRTGRYGLCSERSQARRAIEGSGDGAVKPGKHNDCAFGALLLPATPGPMRLAKRQLYLFMQRIGWFFLRK